MRGVFKNFFPWIKISGGKIDNTDMGQLVPKKGAFTELKASIDPVDEHGVGDRGFNDNRYLNDTDLATAVGNPGVDTKAVSEQGIREALNVIDQKKIKATFFATIASGTTSGTITKPAGAGADIDFIMDEWGTVTDALLSTIENGKPTFKSPVNAGGNAVTTTFDTAGNYTFSDTPVPAADHVLIYVYTCFLKNFNVAESLLETELIDYLPTHADSHDVAGSDDLLSRIIKSVVVKCIADDTALTIADGKAYFTIPIELNGMNLVSVGAHVYAASSSGLPAFQIHNLTQTADMLSTVITIDENEKDSKNAATPAVIDTGNDDVATGDELRFDCDVAGTGTKGTEIRMGFRLP